MAPPNPPSPESDRKLIGNLTVADARHILGCEGGGLTPTQLAFEIVSVTVVAVLTARAISVGNATAWHFFMPMVAQYLALIFALPPIYILLRHPELRKDALQSLRLCIGIVLAVAITVAVRAHRDGVSWQDQFAADTSLAWRWIADAQMQWPIVLSFLGMLAALPGRVHNLYKFGPPFSGVSLGCGMRVVVFFFGCFTLPWALEDSHRMAWTLWTMLVVSELLTFWMLWDIQRELRKLDGAASPTPKARS